MPSAERVVAAFDFMVVGFQRLVVAFHSFGPRSSISVELRQWSCLALLGQLNPGLLFGAYGVVLQFLS